MTASAALAATLVGPLRMAAYATPVSSAPPARASSGSQAAPAPSAKLPTDMPWALATSIRPARIKVLEGGVDESAIWRLFDGRAATGLASDGRVVRFRAELGEPTYLDAVAVFGKVAGTLSLEAEGSKGATSLIQKAALTGGGTGWNRRDFANAPLATAAVFTFEPSAPDAVLPEIELWGRTASAAPSVASATFPDALYSGVPSGARELRAPQGELTISPATVSAPGVGGTFTVDVDVDPAGIDRAFLVYELSGQPHFTAAARSVNGERVLGRFGVSRGAKGGLQVEEISPASLQKGRNRIQFFPADEHSPESYRVSEVRIVAVPHAGTRMTDASAREAVALRDGREATGWRAVASKLADTRRWEFASATQPWGLDFRLPQKGFGTLTVASVTARDQGRVTIKLDGLAAGWHRVPLDKMPATDALTLTLAAGREEAAAISELAIEGSPLPADEAPRVTVTYPLSGECVNHRAHVRGFVTPGADAVYVGGRRLDGAPGRGGAFAADLSEQDAAGRELLVEGTYPGGARVRKVVRIGKCIERPPVVVADDGRPRQPAEDLGAPYGVTVKAGQAASLSFAGVKLDIPAGAVDKDVRLTVRPLPTKQVAPLDPGMTNISPEAQAFRFGPHGMVFKKPISVTLPYSKKLIPGGYTEGDVRTFYYSEDLHRWEQVGLLAQNDGEMVSVTEHFTDFINATIAMPEHPGTQSINPTSLKDIKLADPAAGITRIAPPAPSSSGAAVVRFPIEVPPGRRGIQPNLALTYSNEAGNSWLGLGWDLKPSSIEIDTRFGVPRYTGGETYLLDGEMLTPTANGFYRKRAENSFDIIQRLGSDPTTYSWKVTDKNGTVYIYGATPDDSEANRTRLFGPEFNIFRWYLESVTDVFGNQMTYTYTIGSGPGAATQVYLDQINYTSNVNTGLAASYSVKFTLDALGDRDDAFTTGRPGFLVGTNRFLQRIDVSLNSTMIRRYVLGYTTGAFGRKLLSSVSMIGGDATTTLYTYTFDYHQLINDAGPENPVFRYFDDPVVWGQLRDQVGSTVSSRPENGLTSTDAEMSGINANVGLEWGPFSFHIGGGTAGGSDTGHMRTIDLNGDGLPDFIDDTGGININSLALSPNNPSRFNVQSSIEIPVPLSHTNRSGWNFEGDLGVEFKNSVGNLGPTGGVGLAAGYARTSIEDNRVITDLDGDGFPDVVEINDGAITFNQNQGGQGFGPSSTYGTGIQSISRPVTVSEWDQVKPAGIFPVDTVTRWIAPFDGHVTITGTLNKLDLSRGDGVHASIWLARGTSTTTCKLWEADVTNGSPTCTPSTSSSNSQVCTPNNVIDPCSTGGGAFPPQFDVHGGDRVYMLVDPKADIDADQITWNPTITYDEYAANPNKTEPYGPPVYKFSQQDDFRLAGLPLMTWTANGDGVVLLNMTFNKLPTSDDVNIQLIKNPQRDTATVMGTEIIRTVIAANDSQNASNLLAGPITVQKGDRFVLQVLSDAPIDPARIGFGPSFMQYQAFCRDRGQDANGNQRPPVCGTVDYTLDTNGKPVSARIQGDVIRLSVDTVLRPITPHFPPRKLLPLGVTQSFPAPASSFQIVGTLENFVVGPQATPPVIAYVQGVNKLLAKVALQEFQHVDLAQIQGVVQGEPIFLTVLSQTPDVAPNVKWSPTVNGQPVPFNKVYVDQDFHNMTTTHNPDPFSGGYHGWYVGDFDGTQSFTENLIANPHFPFNRQRDPFMFCFPFNGEDGREPRFRCRGVDSFVEAGVMSPSFAANGLGNGAQKNALRLAETANINVDASARINFSGTGAGVGGGVAVGSTKSTLDFMDMNGDRYPDSAGGAGILYNDGSGHFFASPNPGIGNLRSSSSRNVRGSIDVGGSDVSQLLNIQRTDGKARTVVSTKVGAGVDYGFTSSNVDMEDINGDGLPDQVTNSDPRNGAPGTTTVRFNLGYSFSQPVTWTNPAWTNPQVDTFSALSGLTDFLGADVGTQALSIQDTGTNSASIGGGAQIPVGAAQFDIGGGGGDVQTTMRTMSRMIDVNGDGLPDQVMKVAGDPLLHVKINMGTKFAPEVVWLIRGWTVPGNSNQPLPIPPPPNFAYPSGFAFLQNADTAAYTLEEGWQGSLSFEFCIFFCIGFSGFTTGQGGWSQMDFEDIDGDGKPDHVLKLDGNPNVYAKLSSIANTDMLEKITGPLGDTIEIGYARAGNYVDASQGVDMPTNHWVLSSVRTGDGRGNFYTDHFNYNVYNPTNTTAPPIPSGHYDRDEREDYGFGHLEITRGQFANGAWREGDGSQVERFFYNQDFYLKGRLKAEFEMDHFGELIHGSRIDIPQPPTPNKVPGADVNSIRTGFFFPQTENRYTLLYEKTAGFLAIQTDLTATTFAAQKTKRELRQFDDRGNLTSFVDYGDPQLPSTEIDYTIAWTPFDATANITRPTDIKATAGPTGALLRERTATYFEHNGALRSLTNIVSGGKVPGSGTPGTSYSQASATSFLVYDSNGNVLAATDPAGYRLQYTYDTAAQTYVTRVDDTSFGYFSTASYDLRFGAVTSSTDVNGQPESYTYDQFGRLCTVRGPDDQNGASVPTIAMSYGIIPASCPNAPAAGAAFPAYAVTRHKDVQHAGDPIDTVTFIDGLGRVIQTKKDLDRDTAGNGSVTTGMSVSGQVLFDTRGRVSSQAQPGFSSAATTTFVAAGNGNNPTLLGYDVIGRQTSSIVPDGTPDGIVTTTTHSIASPDSNPADNLGDGHAWLWTEVLDGNAFGAGEGSNIGRRLSYADSRGNVIAMREFDQIGTSTALTPLTTQYSYDPIDQLLTVTDARGNATSSIYDTMGRMVTLTNLDAGQTEYRYDLNGNLKEKQTPVLRGQSKSITYAYDFNRLKSITYPTLTQVTYAYGGPTEAGDAAGNVAGRIKKVTYEAGNETRTYDHLGNVNKTITTLNRMSTTTGLPTTIAFTMKYAYDWLGRMQSMTFPNWIDSNYNIIAGEGELVSYVYDHGGNIDKITGFDQTANPQQTSAPRNFTYLSHVGYNEFEQRTALVSGNGIANKYLYEPTTRRLSDVQADSHPAGQQTTPFHRLHYTYDKVGNVTHMVNNVSVRSYLNAPVFVGPLDMTYTYDNLYQLRTMTQKYRGNVAYGYQSSDAYTFDEIGNIKTKAQSQDRLVWDNQTVNQGDTNPVVTQLAGSRFDHNVAGLSYALSYTYPAARPHGATPVSETPAGSAATNRSYTYDANGNNTGNTFKTDSRAQVWDEESRLKQVTQNGGSLAQFKYDDTGERRKKMTAAGDSWYVNQYFVLLPGNQPTKHIFAGETRVATKTDAINYQTPVLHYYHPDHLGTTSYLTNASQVMVQHERYFAYGEVWRPAGEQEEANPSDRRNWLFTSKEWDVDTNLYYFGARYFDPHTDVWQSTDPILASYMQRGTAGASPKNLGLYSYAWNNPIVLRDPDGRQTPGLPSYVYDLPGHEGETMRAQGMAADWLVRGFWNAVVAAVFGGAPMVPYAAPHTVDYSHPPGQPIVEKLSVQNNPAGNVGGAVLLIVATGSIGVASTLEEAPAEVAALRAGTGEIALEHGTTAQRAASIRSVGPDPAFIEPGGGSPAGGFSTAPAGGPYPLGSPEQYAAAKAALFPGEGGPAVLRVVVPRSIVNSAIRMAGEVRFEPGFGLKELLEAWPGLVKSIR